MNEFRFYSKYDLTLLVGRRARTGKELLEGVQEVPDSSIYFHTHKFLQRYHYLTPLPPNDFANWTINSLNDDPLGEQLSSIDVVQFERIVTLRERLVDVLENHFRSGKNDRECPPGEEFYFMASQTFVFPTSHVASNLKDFGTVLETISLDSLYHHMFDARLRLGRGENDFSAWFRGNGFRELADEVKRFDPYVHTLDGLRKRILVLLKRYI